MDAANHLIRSMTGQQLYKQSYDPVNRNVEGREQERIRRRQDQEQRNAQQAEMEQAVQQMKVPQKKVQKKPGQTAKAPPGRGAR